MNHGFVGLTADLADFGIPRAVKVRERSKFWQTKVGRKTKKARTSRPVPFQKQLRQDVKNGWSRM
jgi:hypothetical protein